MPRYVVCQHCKESVVWSEKDKMKVESIAQTSGKVKNKYIHEECWNKYLKKKDFIAKEEEGKDELNDVIKEIHSIKYQIPPRIWEILQDLRNGTNRYQKFWKKKYKNGVPYEVIAEAYRIAKDSILWSILNKRFKGKEAELIYGMKIMQSKIEDAHKKVTRTKQSEKLADAQESSQIEGILDNREVEFKNTKKTMDLSDILGDD